MGQHVACRIHQRADGLHLALQGFVHRIDAVALLDGNARRIRHRLRHLIRCLRRLLGTGRQLLRGRRDLLDRVVCMMHELGDTLLHRHKGIDHLAEFILAGHRALLRAEIPSSQAFARCIDDLQRMHDRS